ncbi:MAG: glycosyltransferase family A protein [Chloroflexota bacterium]
MNPARGRFTDYRPARVTVAVLVHIPHLAGYFEQRLDVLKVCLGSILEHTDQPYDLLVFNNGSCEEVCAYLDGMRQSGEIRYLLSSGVNLGKIGAFQILFRAAPGEVVAYSDDDIYHYPGWLSAHLEILDTFPNVGVVSGCAVRSLFEEERISSNLRFAEREPGVVLKRGRFIPQEWIEDWAESYGREMAMVEKETAGLEDMILEYRGVQAYAMANHNQFVTPKDVITRCLPESWSGRLMGEMNELDIRVNRAGFLRLTTIHRTTQHMGNRLNPKYSTQFTPDTRRISEADSGPGLRKRVARRFLLARPVRWFLLGIYSRLFRLLNPD